MNTQDGKATPEQILQFMTTEHFTLQTAKSAVHFHRRYQAWKYTAFEKRQETRFPSGS